MNALSVCGLLGHVHGDIELGSRGQMQACHLSFTLQQQSEAGITLTVGNSADIAPVTRLAWHLTAL